MDRKHVMMILQHGKNEGMCMSLVCPKSSVFVRDFASLLIEKPSNIYITILNQTLHHGHENS